MRILLTRAALLTMGVLLIEAAVYWEAVSRQQFTTLAMTRSFVLTRQNAVAYFNPSSEIKFTDKRTIHGKLRLPKYQSSFRGFLQQNVNEAYVRQS